MFNFNSKCVGTVTHGRLYSDDTEYFYQFVSSHKPMFTQLITAVIVGTHKQFHVALHGADSEPLLHEFVRNEGVS